MEQIMNELKNILTDKEFLAYVDKQYQTELRGINKQKAKYQALINTKFSANKVIKEQQQAKNVVLDNYIKNDGKRKFHPSKLTAEELTQLLTDLKELN